jgi:hypothetical protein
MGRSTSALRAEIPSGALVAFLHKGLQLLHIEAHIDEVGGRLCGGATGRPLGMNP